MEDVYVGVDRDLEKIYIDLLRKLLINPEKWEKKRFDGSQYISPYINEESQLRFCTHGNSSDNYLSSVKIIDKGESIVHELPIGSFDYQTRKLMKRLYRFMEHQNEWIKSQRINRVLKESLGSGFERAQKLLKIKKKISEE